MAAQAESHRYESERKDKDINKLVSRIAELEAELAASSPDNSRFEILAAEQVGPHLVLMVKYPNCKKCSYEGQKIMVFLDVTAIQALKWRKIDPHFADPTKEVRTEQESPSPVARFPASSEGWEDAITYAHMKG